jgi:hypothetical protein
MGRPSKEFQAFTSLVDRLLEVPKDEIVRRVEAEKAASAANPNRRGPKPKVKRASRASGG